MRKNYVSNINIQQRGRCTRINSDIDIYHVN